MTTVAEPKKIIKDPMKMTKEEVEEFFSEATRRAQQRLHAKGIPYVIGDKDGMYEVYPDGKKIFTPYSKVKND